MRNIPKVPGEGLIRRLLNGSGRLLEGRLPGRPHSRPLTFSPVIVVVVVDGRRIFVATDYRPERNSSYESRETADLQIMFERGQFAYADVAGVAGETTPPRARACLKLGIFQRSVEVG